MKTLPFLPLRGIAILPGVVTPMYVGRMKSIKTLERAVTQKSKLVFAVQKNESVQDPQVDKDIYRIGVVATIMQIVKMPNDNIKVLVEASERVKLINPRIEDDVYLTDYEVVESYNEDMKEARAIYRKALSLFEQYIKLNKTAASDILITLKNVKNISQGLDIIVSHMNLPADEKQLCLEYLDVTTRGMEVITLLSEEIEMGQLEEAIESRVKKNMAEAQKNYYLREKINVIKDEITDGDSGDDVSELLEKIKKAKLPKKIENKMVKETKKLSKMPPFSAESTVLRNYVETVIALPWKKQSKDIVDLKKANKILERDHYGLKDAKEKVLDYLAVKKLNPNMKGSILCFAGPPGIGKTSLGKSIADAMGRKFVRVSLGGVRDEAEIRGHRRTYIGSMPGKIIKALSEAGTDNPVMLLDEIDKMSNDYKGDPSSAMLEVLDPEQNSHFEDHYIDMPYDLSKVFFIATANDLRTIARPLLDRMDIVELSSYTEYEKLHIAKKYLIPQAIKENGLEKIDISISDKIILKIINDYTREAGVRNLKRQFITMCRKIAKMVVKDDVKSLILKVNHLEKYLGKPKFRPEKQKEKTPKLGVVNGLAWTAVGGVTLEVQGVAVAGKGTLALTGTLGKVMTESAQVAYTYVKANLDKYQPHLKNFFKEKSIHLHFPEGATPKDGPSAGITITTAIISVMTDKKIRQDIAMTGEITITGEVLAIGGVREKVIGAHRAGIYEVILPIDNKKDIDDIPEEVAKHMTIHFATTYDDVAKLVFE